MITILFLNPYFKVFYPNIQKRMFLIHLPNTDSTIKTLINKILTFY